jgi:hypothetical protein
VLSASDEIARQILSLTGDGGSRPLVEFLPTYESATFAPEGTPAPPVRPFRVLFVGRVEEDKGVFDVLRMAKDLRAAGPPGRRGRRLRHGIRFGSARRGGARGRLENAFRCHGHCLRDKMRQMYAACHVVIVPTTADFVEGFNQVVVERCSPVVRSRLQRLPGARVRPRGGDRGRARGREGIRVGGAPAPGRAGAAGDDGEGVARASRRSSWTSSGAGRGRSATW